MNNFLTSLSIFLVVFGTVFSALDRTPEIMQKGIKHKAGTSWEEYKLAFGKSFWSEAHEAEHKGAFLNRQQLINEHNEAFERGDFSYKLGISAISDLTEQERQSLNGFRFRNNRQNERHHNNHHGLLLGAEMMGNHNHGFGRGNNEGVDLNRLPRAVDWRRGNGSIHLVTSVKNQGHCGSCWAFSTAGLLEAANAKATGRLVDLSPQNLVDCDEINHGCKGGYPMMALTYAIDEGGLNIEKAYPYVGVDAECRFDNLKPVGGSAARQIVPLPVGDELALMAAVASQGPISVAIQVTNNFLDYAGGIFNDRTCRNSLLELNHAILLVGYGTDTKWGDYWIVKNSWGMDWGEDGYIRMARNKNNQCGIATQAVYVQN